MSISALPLHDGDDKIMSMPHRPGVQTLLEQVTRHLSPSTDSEPDQAVVHQPFENPTPGHLLQMIRDSANELLECTGGRSASEPSPGTMAYVADDQRQMQNITRVSGEIVRNLAHIISLQTVPQTLDHRHHDPHDEMDLGGPDDHTLTIDALPVFPTVLAPRRIHSRRTSRLVCRDCHRHVTPKWRAGPHGPGTLCNVCGLLYAKRMGIVGGLHDR